MDFLPGDELTGTLQQQHKNPERLLLQTNPAPRLGEFAFLEISLEGPKTNNPACGPAAACAPLAAMRRLLAWKVRNLRNCFPYSVLVG